MTPFKTKISAYTGLTAEEVYQILRLRSEIFVVEQNCVFLDADNRDQEAFHLLWMDGQKLVGYTRIFGPETMYQEPSIGRVVTHSSIRGKGFGNDLMKQSIEWIQQKWSGHSIRIFGQAYLKSFYERLGFVIVSEPVEEDGILHYYMVLNC